MADANGAVLQVAVVEAEAGIEEDFFDAGARGDIDLAGEIIVHHADRVGAKVEVSDFANVSALDVAKDYCAFVCSGNVEEFLVVLSGCEIQNSGAGIKTRPGDSQLISFDGDQNARGTESFDDGKKFVTLESYIGAGGVRKRGFCAKVDDIGALCAQDFAATNGGFGRKTNAFTIPGVGGKIDHAHDCRLGVKAELMGANGELADVGLCRSAVPFEEVSQVFEA